jgi:hypothetical protein
VSDVAPQDTVTPRADGGVDIVTTRDAEFPLHMDWSSFRPDLPAGAVITQVETRVCGRGGGDFYEVYGPYDSDPVEYEVTPPAADGCWHFVGPSSDWYVTIYVYGDSTMTIERIEFAVTADR